MDIISLLRVKRARPHARPIDDLLPAPFARVDFGSLAYAVWPNVTIRDVPRGLTLNWAIGA
jgi:hypothetical protein